MTNFYVVKCTRKDGSVVYHRSGRYDKHADIHRAKLHTKLSNAEYRRDEILWASRSLRSEEYKFVKVEIVEVEVSIKEKP